MKGGRNMQGLKHTSPIATAEDVPASYIPQMTEQGEKSCHRSYVIPYLGNFITSHLLDPSKASEAVLPQ